MPLPPRASYIRALALALAFVLAPLAAKAQHVQIPGTTVSLVPPEGFSIATEYAGLANKAKNSSVLVVEFPLAAGKELSGLFANIESVKANFARQQVAIETLDTVALPAGRVPLATGTQKVGPHTFDKWIALLEGEKVVLVTMQGPQSSQLAAADVLAMLKSIRLGPAPTIADKMKSLPFMVQPAEPFRVIDTLGGLGLLMTVGPLDADPSEAQPNAIVALQQSPGLDARDIETIGAQLLRSTRGYAEAVIMANERVPFAGVEGLRMRGTRKSAAGVEKEFVHYLAISDNGRHIRFIAAADAQQMRELAPALDAMVKSIAFKAN